MPSFSLVTVKWINNPIITPDHFMEINRQGGNRVRPGTFVPKGARDEVARCGSPWYLDRDDGHRNNVDFGRYFLCDIESSSSRMKTASLSPKSLRFLSCISQGKTRSEVIDSIKEAIAGYLESLQAHGEPVPPSITEEVVEVTL